MTTLKEQQAVSDFHGKWLPIETAPKDGTEVIVYREDAGCFLARWIAPIDFCTEHELRDLSEECAETADWFYADFVSGGRLEGKEIPTHWMSYTPPKESE